MKRALLISLILLNTALLNAQVLFNKAFGGASEDQGRSVKQTLDKGYIVACATSSLGIGGNDVFLLKLDSMGMHQWSRTYGGLNAEWGYSVVQLQDSGYAVAGYTNSFGAGGYDMYLIRTDKNGDTLWTKTYGGTDWDLAYSIQATSDGGFILCGTTGSYGAGNDDVYLVKTNAMGDTLWTRTFGTTGNEEGRSVWQNTDGGYFITGSTTNSVNGGIDIYYIRTDANGSAIWTRTLGGALDEESYSGMQALDGNFVMAGYTDSYSAGSDVGYIVKTNVNGDTLWTRQYIPINQGYEGRFYSLCEAPDYTLAMTGYLLGSQGYELYFFKTDIDGIFLAATTHGNSTGDEQGYSVRSCADGGYIIAGTTSSFGHGLHDIYVIKTAYNGLSSPYNAVEEYEQKPSAMLVYPNPAAASATFVLPRGVNSETALRITDVTGRELMTITAKAYDRLITLDCSSFSNGLYFYTLTGKGKVLAQGKFIK
jgi:hypothetical protein